MIPRIAIYYAVTISIATYAVRRGGEPERWVAGMIVVASIATSFIPYQRGHTFHSVVAPLLAIDTLLLLGLTVVALYANRFWPLYVCAIHMLAVALHGVRAVDPNILPVVYARLGGELAYPVLGLVALGTLRHRNRCPETDWSWQINHEARRL